MERNIETLNVADGWIYYVDHSDKSLYRIKTDGSEKQLICSDNAFNVNIIQDYIYYDIYDRTNGDTKKCLYRIKMDGSERQVFCEL